MAAVNKRINPRLILRTLDQNVLKDPGKRASWESLPFTDGHSQVPQARGGSAHNTIPQGRGGSIQSTVSEAGWGSACCRTTASGCSHFLKTDKSQVGAVFS
jgi:hypothetical protein